MKSMIAFMIPNPQKDMYFELQEKIFLEFGGKKLGMPPHITLKIPFNKDPEELAQMFDGFSSPKFTIERTKFYRFGEYVAYDAIGQSFEMNKLANSINNTLIDNGVTLRADDKDRTFHITVAKSKGRGMHNFPAYQVANKLNAMHHAFPPIKVNKFTICKKTDKGWRSHANITLGR